jgi:hypothetical protein
MPPEGVAQESQAALETFRSSGPDTEQRPASSGCPFADAQPVFEKEAE